VYAIHIFFFSLLKSLDTARLEFFKKGQERLFFYHLVIFHTFGYLSQMKTNKMIEGGG